MLRSVLLIFFVFWVVGFVFLLFVLCFFIFVRIVAYPLFAVSLDESFLIAASCFSNVYLGREYRYLQFLSHVIIIKAKVLLHQT